MKIRIEIEVGKNMTDEAFKMLWKEQQIAMKICALIESLMPCFVFKIKVED